MGALLWKVIPLTIGLVKILPKKACFLLIKATMSLSLLSTNKLTAASTE